MIFGKADVLNSARFDFRFPEVSRHRRQPLCLCHDRFSLRFFGVELEKKFAASVFDCLRWCEKLRVMDSWKTENELHPVLFYLFSSHLNISQRYTTDANCEKSEFRLNERKKICKKRDPDPDPGPDPGPGPAFYWHPSMHFDSPETFRTQFHIWRRS